jgi:hypothetical protein
LADDTAAAVRAVLLAHTDVRASSSTVGEGP